MGLGKLPGTVPVRERPPQTPDGHETYLSKVAARMYLPLGENFTKDTGGLSSSGGKECVEGNPWP